MLDGIATGPEGLHAYFVHSFHFLAADRGRHHRDAPIMAAPLTAMVGARQYRRRAVSSGEEPDAGADADRQFPEVAAVILFPAIDLKSGAMRSPRFMATWRRPRFSIDDPAAQALIFERQGFEYLHVVDLDGAFAGKPMNAAAGRCDSGGADRHAGPARRRHPRHADHRRLARQRRRSRVIIGTAAVRDPDLVREAARNHPGRIAVGIDARDGLVAVEGWAKSSRADRRRTRAGASRTPASPRSSTPTSPATAC